MKYENTEVFNFEGALRGMRNPCNSWDKSDSRYIDIESEEGAKLSAKGIYFIIGKNDIELAQKLVRKDTLKFARRMEKNNTLRGKRYGSECGRNLPKTAQRELSLYKRCNAIYVCKYCGCYHFSSINLKNK